MTRTVRSQRAIPSSPRSATASSQAGSVRGETSCKEISSEAAGPVVVMGQRRSRRLALAGVAALVAVTASPAWAELPPRRCPALAGGSAVLVDIDPELRLRWIDDRLARTAHAARVWTWGWGTGLVVATAANLAPLGFVAPEDRIDWYVGAGTTVIGVVPLVIAPLDVVG